MNYDKDQLADMVADRLDVAAESLMSQWYKPEGTRTRHFVLDQVLPDDIAQKVARAFPRDGEGFADRNSFRERKKTLAQLGRTDPLLRAVSIAFQHPDVIRRMERITGIQALEPDRTLYAGGLSMMFPGDFLNPHIDNSHDGDRQRYRRVNVLYYVNPSWELASGGNFELWDEDVKIPKTLVSGFNRLVAMETNKHSWHSVSRVLADKPRCCVSNYYFSKESPDGDDYFHVTSFTGRPEELAKRIVGPVDNAMRNAVLKTFKTLVPGKKFSDDKSEN